MFRILLPTDLAVNFWRDQATYLLTYLLYFVIALLEI